MTYSIETHTGSHEMRQGFYETLDAAKRSILRDERKPRAAAIYEGGGTTGGRLVAVFDPDEGWIDVEDVAVAEWWDDVPQGVRDWLLDNPGKPLPPRVWVWVVQAGGLVAGAQWVGPETLVDGSPAGMMLSLADEEWLRVKRALGGD